VFSGLVVERGEGEAWSWLVRQYREILLRRIAGRFPDIDPESAVQETFKSVRTRHLVGLVAKTKEPLKAYLLKVAIHEAIKLAKAAGRRRKRETTVKDFDVIAGNRAS